MTVMREMRRSRQLLPEEDSREILRTSTNGILSLIDPEGRPYGVPLSFAYDGGEAVYFHSALRGYKLDCIDACPECSFCVVAQDSIVPEEFTTYFRSVIVSGTVSRVTDRDEIIRGLMLLCDKYSPGVDPDAEITGCLSRVAVLRLDISSVSGKESIELVRRRSNTSGK